ncbi:ribosome silencing factor [Rubinisphaera margarita]|uniref:ribosome silencing factor n=1 Tax=Rubinisphaera margarita TaxID=2909586 RepID=UPI001EE7AF91|nr:ribosome silencing factor [Rubinisphaera margarita]MCG6156915.1 ribosome silencing factor [Rubinisphaera margarita]
MARSLDLACRCAQLADELKAKDIIVLDLTRVTPEFDYFIIATGNSRRQLHAIAEEADTLMEKSGSARIGIEGYDSNAWILQDYGDVVLHAFDPASREMYDLERLWADATRVDWQAYLAEHA